jgi:hypothetical protein
VDKPENIDPSVQMRALRFILGRNYKPLSSDELAGLIHIPPIAVRAVESRRRKFSADDRQNIEILAGAIWDEKSNQWVTTWDHTPYTREKYDFYIGDKLRDQDRNPNPERAALRAQYHRMVDLYLEGLEVAIADLALTKLYRELRRIAEKDDVNLEALEQEAVKEKKKSR